MRWALFSGAQTRQVEHAAQIDEERIGALPSENLPPAAERMHRLGTEPRLVLRGAALADVARRNLQALRQHRRLVVAALVDDPGDAVVLRPVEVRIVDTGDRAGVVEERVLVPDVGGEPELVADVGLRAAVVGDVDRVQHVIGELVEVRPPVGKLERDEVGDQGDGIRCVGADERVDVGVVGVGILGDLGCFAVGRHDGATFRKGEAGRAIRPEGGPNWCAAPNPSGL